MINTAIDRTKFMQARPEMLLLAGYLLACIYFLYDYFITDIYLFAGLAAAPFAFIIQGREIFSFRYLYAALLLVILAYFSDILTLYYLSAVFSVLFLIESRIGKINYLFPSLLIVLSPIFKYFVNTLGFPIRLGLTEICGKLLSFLGKKADVYGNILMIEGNEFAVDPECVGLKMMTISFIIGIIFLAYFSRKEKKQGGLMFTGLMMIIILGLNVLCNLTRILVLVLFNIAPEDPFHDLAGMLCLVTYVAIPFYFISRFAIGRITPEVKMGKTNSKHRLSLPLNILLLAAVILTGFKLNNNQSENNSVFPTCNITAYQKKELPNGVIKFETKNSLVYVKPIEGFYSAEHSPMICWIGSGYKFKSINKKTIDGIEVYIGTLIKEKEKIYASWWFDNGSTKTISQMDWRWRVISGEKKFSLVNVNAVTEAELEIQTKSIIHKNIFQ